MKKNIKNIFTSILLGIGALCLVGGVVFLGAFDKAEKVHASEVLDSFLIEETAAVRRTEPNGIRFTTTLDDTTKSNVQSLKDKGYTVSYGTLMLPSDMLGANELTFDTQNVLNIPQTKWQEEGTTYTSVLAGTDNGDGSFANLPESYYNRVITARGYVKCEDSNGNTVTYYTANTAERSMGYVAMMATLIPNSKTGEVDTSELITNIAAKTTVEVALPETLSVNASENDGLIYNAIESTASVLKVGGMVVPDEILEKLGDSYSVSYNIGGDNVVEYGKKLKANAVGSYNVKATVTLGDIQVSGTQSVTVTDDFVGVSDYKILLSKNASENEKKAAEKLQNTLWESTGATLPIQYENGYETTAGKYISVGETALVGKQSVAVDNDKDTASVVKTVGNALFLRGKTDMGTFYGAQKLLNTLVGYEFYLENTYALNGAQAVGMPADAAYTPAIEYNYNQTDYNVQDDYAFQAYSNDVLPIAGSIAHNSIALFGTNLADDYYSKELQWGFFETVNEDANGNPIELCYTGNNGAVFNNMVNTLATAVKEALAAEEAAGGTRNRVGFSISDAGSEGWCICDGCEANGNASDNLVYFLNAVCAKLEADGVTDFKIVSLFYHQTNVAPTKEIPNEHIEIWFAESWADYTVGIANENNATKNVITNFNAWMDILEANYNNDVLWWTYYTNVTNHFTPYGSLTAIKENYKLAAENGIDAFFNQTTQNRSAWTRLKLYMMSKLAWNADPTDEVWDGWFNSYFTNAYGPGAENMKTLYDVMMNSASATWQRSYTDATEEIDSADRAIGQEFSSTDFDEETLNDWIGYADAAIAALDISDPNYETYYNNIMLERLAPMFLLVHFHNDTTYAAEFGEYAQKWNVTKFGESSTLSNSTNYAAVAPTLNNAVSTKFVANASGSVVLKAADTIFTADSTWKLNGTTYTVETAGQLVVDLSDYAKGQHELTFIGTASTINFTNVWVTGGEHVITATLDDYYKFNGADTVANGGTYTFTVNNTLVANNNLAVVANGAILTPVNGVYSVENVTSDLNIGIVELSHRTSQLIEDNGTGTYTDVAYDEASKTYILTDSVNDGHAGIDGSYLAYMYAQGAQQISFKLTIDGEVAKGGWVSYNGKNVVGMTDALTNTYTIPLVSGCITDMNFWVMNEKNSGAAINGQGGWMKVENLSFDIGVDKPESAWYTITGEDTVSPGEDYTFTLEPTVTGMDDFAIYVNGKQVTLTNNSYTVKNVQSTVDIDVVHPYIEKGDKDTQTITYDVDTDTYTITNSTHFVGNLAAYISADYINKMIAQGYVQVEFTYSCDGSIAVSPRYKYNEKIVVCTPDTTVTIDLVEGANSSIQFIGTDANGSGTAVQESNGKIYVQGLTWINSDEVTLGNTQEVDLALGYDADNTALVYSEDSVALDVSSVEIGNVESITFNGAELAGASYAAGVLTVPKASFGNAYGEQTVVVKARVEDTLVSVNVPVLLVSKVLTTAEDVQNFGHIAKLVGTGNVLQSGYFTLGNNIDFSTYNEGVYIPYLQRNQYNPGWGTPEAVGFNGVFDGCGYTISNMTIGDGTASGSNSSGFIPVLHKDGIIRNVAFTNVKTNMYANSGILTSTAGGLIENIYIQFTYAYNNAGQLYEGVQSAAGVHGLFYAVKGSQGNATPTVRDVYIDITSAKYEKYTVETETLEVLDMYTTGGCYALGGSNDNTYQFVNYEGAYVLVAHANNANKVNGVSGAMDGSVYGAFIGKSALVADAAAQAELATWDTNYWTIVNGVPVWGKYNVVTVSEEMYAETATGSLVLENEIFAAGDIYTYNGVAYTAADGTLAITDISAFTLGETYEINLYGEENILSLSNVVVVTKVITTIEEMNALAVNKNSTADVTGYYVLGDDLDYSSAGTVAAGTYGGSYYFKATFDGKGHTISNITVGEGGLFGDMNGATVKNVNFTGVTLGPVSNTAYAGLLGSRGANVTVSGVSATYTAVNVGNYSSPYNVYSGLLFGRSINGSTWTNVSLDASGLYVPNVLSAYLANFKSATNVTITVGAYDIVGYPEWTMSGDEGTLPEGITLVGAKLETISDEMYAEMGVSNQAILYSESFVEGESYTLSGGATGTATVETAGQLTVTLSSVTEESVQSVMLMGSGKAFVFDNIFGVTRAIRTVDDLSLVRYVANSASAITGYYVLANDINANGATIAAGGYDWNVRGFQGTFDGRNNTVSNFTAGQGGIFGILHKATIKDVNFTGVSVTKDSYAALFASMIYQGTTISNVTAQFVSIATPSAANVDVGLIASRLTGNNDSNLVKLENVVIDARGIEIYSVFGTSFSTSCTQMTNVTVYANSVKYLADSASGNSKSIVSGSETSTLITSIDGVTVSTEYEAITVSDEMYAEAGASNQAILYSEEFLAGESYTLSGDATGTATVAAAGQLTVTLTEVAEESVYSVVATGNGKAITFNNVFGVTRAIRTVDDLSSVMYKSGDSIDGYYVLADDINVSGATLSAGSYTWGYGFIGTFDGKRHTISNFTAGTGGIFNALYGATVKNVNFTGVSVNGDSYAALLASIANNATISGVSASFVSAATPSNTVVDVALMVSRQTGNNTVYENVTVDASGLDVYCVFGAELGIGSTTFTNVTVIAKSIARLADSKAGGNKSIYTGSETSTAITSIDGVTVNVEYVLITVSDEMYAETGASNQAILSSEEFLAGESYTLSGDATGTATVATAGQLTVTLTEVAEESVYSVVATGNGKAITFSNVFGVTKAIRTIEEMETLAVDSASTANIEGYYALANNLDYSSAGTIYTGGYGGSYNFKGTFDGRNRTISNITVGTGGLFGNMSGATVKNVIFTDVTLGQATVAAATAGYVGLLGHNAVNVTVSDVSASYIAINQANYNNAYEPQSGLLFGRSVQGHKWTNVTLDAGGLVVPNLFAANVNSFTSASNVVIVVSSYDIVGYTGWTMSGDSAALPAGVKVITQAIDSNYYDIVSAPAAESGYTFTLNAKVAGCDEFIVLADGVEVTPVDGVYTVAESATVVITHGYIETGSPATATYAEDGTNTVVTLKHIAFNSRANNGYWASLSADYINYMISQGYTTMTFTLALDGVIARQGLCLYNGASKGAFGDWDKDDDATDATYVNNVTITLETATSDMFFWFQGSTGSGTAIKDDTSAWMTVSNLTFSK